MARNKIPREFDTLTRHIWYDQMQKNKEKRKYEVVEQKVHVDPFWKEDGVHVTPADEPTVPTLPIQLTTSPLVSAPRARNVRIQLFH